MENNKVENDRETSSIVVWESEGKKIVINRCYLTIWGVELFRIAFLSSGFDSIIYQRLLPLTHQSARLITRSAFKEGVRPFSNHLFDGRVGENNRWNQRLVSEENGEQNVAGI